MDLTNNSNKTLFFLLLYLSLLIGFYFGENSAGGAYPDFIMRTELIEKFKNNFISTFLNYNNFEDRHSPILLMLISSLSILGIDLDIIRFIHLNFLPLLIFISYKCLSLKFKNENKNIIFLICCVFFLSPSLRSIAIWPDSRILGLIIFLFSTYFFLKFKNTHEFKDCIYNNILLIISAYISPNFSIFFLYFVFYYVKYFKFSQKLILIILINFILSLPILYYLFILDVNFLATTAISNISVLHALNPANKIFIISTLLLFFITPFIIRYFSINNFIKNFKINHLFVVLIIFSCLFYFFNYSIEYTGGGIFYRLSYFIFGNSYFFFIITFISMLFIMNVFKLNFNNLLLFIILILSNPQLTIYHKYFDPLLLLLFFLFFDFKFDKTIYINKKFLTNIYVFYFILLLINFGRYLI